MVLGAQRSTKTGQQKYHETTRRQPDPNTHAGFDRTQGRDRSMYRCIGPVHRWKEKERSRAHDRYDRKLKTPLSGKYQLAVPQKTERWGYSVRSRSARKRLPPPFLQASSRLVETQSTAVAEPAAGAPRRIHSKSIPLANSTGITQC